MEKSNKINMPVFFLSLVIIFTFLPILYKYFPLFGTIRIVLLAGIGLLVSYILTSHVYKNMDTWRRPLFILFVLFFLIMILSLFVSLDRGGTLEVIKMYLRYLIIVAIMVKVIDNVDKLNFVIGLFVVCGLGMAMNTIVNYFFSGFTFLGSIRGSAIESGIFADPNDLALFLNVILVLLFYYFFRGKRKIIFLSSILIVISAIILTYSRGGLLGMLTVFVGLVIFRKSERKKLVLLGIVFALIFIPFVTEEYKERMSTITTEARVDPETGEYPGRMQAWVNLIPVGFRRPLLGVGAGNSVYLAGEHTQSWHLAHNSFLQAFLDLGLLGFAIFSTLFVLPFRQYQKLKKNHTEEVKHHIDRYQFLLISLTAFGVTAFFLPQAYSVILPFLIAFLIIQIELFTADVKKLSGD